MTPLRKPGSSRLTGLIMLGLVLGIIVGIACNRLAPDPDATRAIAGYFSVGTDLFLRLIKMIIAPLVFATIVSGIASFGSSGSIGRVALRALAWFLLASLASLALGLLFANLFAPGHGLTLPLPPAGASSGLQTTAFNLKDFASHIVPASFVQAMAGNDVLQILVFSVFFGLALRTVGGPGADAIRTAMEGLVAVMLRVTDAVMRFAPLGVFAAIAAVVTTQGPGVLLSYGKFIGEFYLGLSVLWLLILAAGFLVLGRPVLRLLRLLREPMLLAFSTASSEAAFPKMIEQLSAFGVRERVSGFVLPLGYSFNLDGSMMYQAFAALFVAQAYGIEMSLPRQVALLLVMMLTSKGIAGVPRASLVVVAATLPMFDLPASGMLLIMGIDQLLDMGRTMTNVIGNGVATAAVAKWEGELESSVVLGAAPVPARTSPA